MEYNFHFNPREKKKNVTLILAPIVTMNANVEMIFSRGTLKFTASKIGHFSLLKIYKYIQSISPKIFRVPRESFSILHFDKINLLTPRRDLREPVYFPSLFPVKWLEFIRVSSSFSYAETRVRFFLLTRARSLSSFSSISFQHIYPALAVLVSPRPKITRRKA